jgi:hypothetical protein
LKASAPEKMHMKMLYALSSVLAGIDNEAESLFRESFAAGYELRGLGHSADDLNGSFHYGIEMLLRNDENV